MCFHSFYETWFDRLRHLHQQLASAPRPTNGQDEQRLSQLVDKVLTHYQEYYLRKSQAIKHDVLSMFTPAWTTCLERSLLWIGGWRPTTVFHLVYTESSVRFEAQILDILRGHRTGDLGDLSPGQLGRVSELQCQTVRGENDISEELFEWQDSASDLVSTCSDPDEKIKRLVNILEMADDLRLTTIRRVVEMLSPQQAVEFLVAANELHFGVHAWGLDHDRRRVKV